jgi:hypothetical protein
LPKNSKRVFSSPWFAIDLFQKKVPLSEQLQWPVSRLQKTLVLAEMTHARAEVAKSTSSVALLTLLNIK